MTDLIHKVAKGIQRAAYVGGLDPIQDDDAMLLATGAVGVMRVPDWRPITSAPTDGRPIIGWSDEGVSYVCWHSKGRWTFLKNYRGDEWHFEPTKWLPHPAFPTSES